MKNEVDILFNCPVCGKKYVPDASRIVSGDKESLMVHVNCPACGIASLAVISRNNRAGNLLTVGMLTDLDYEEACATLNTPPVSSDEVLDIHQGNYSF